MKYVIKDKVAHVYWQAVGNGLALGIGDSFKYDSPDEALTALRKQFFAQADYLTIVPVEQVTPVPTGTWEVALELDASTEYRVVDKHGAFVRELVHGVGYKVVSWVESPEIWVEVDA